MADKGKDRRRFRRYRAGGNFTLHIGGRSYRAKVLDYSLEGLGMQVQDTPPLQNGHTLEVNLQSPPLRRQGRVMWFARQGDATRVGLMLLGPFEGQLGYFLLSDVLMGLQRSLRTGVLELQAQGLRRKLYFRQGDLVFASGDTEADSLWAYLQSSGRLKPQELEALRGRDDRQVGAALVKAGLLSARELAEAVKAQVQELLTSLFDIQEGAFCFREGPLPKDIIALRLPVAHLIYRGLRRIQNPRVLRRYCPSLKEVLCFSPNPLDLFQDLRPEDRDKQVLSLIDGKTSVQDILRLSPLPEEETLRCLCALMGTRVVVPASEVEEAPAVQAQEVFEAEVPEAPSAQEELLQKIEQMHRLCQEETYYEALGLKHWAGPEELKQAYYRRAKEFHPDRHFYLTDDVKAKLSEIFATISQAYSTLRDPEARRRYDQSLQVAPARLGSNTELAQRKFREGIKRLRLQEFERAEQAFAEASYLDATQPQYQYYYGVALLRQQKYRAAERALQRALKLQPLNPDVLAELGHVYLALGFPTRARGNFQRALKEDPDNQRAREGLASLKS